MKSASRTEPVPATTRRVLADRCAPIRARQRSDRGSASLLVLAVGLMLVAGGVAGSAVAAAHLARQQARVAADFGALAGAGTVLDGPAAACARAADLVRANGGRPAACVVDGLDLLVTAEVEVTPLPGLTRTVRSTARAGPVRG